MSFEFQPYQLLVIVFCALLAFAFWKLEKKSYRIGIAAFAVVLFVANPIKHKQEGGAQIERFAPKQVYLPKRVHVKEKSFEQKQSEQLNDLKKQSGEMKDEIKN